jgi:hypothetical protein
MNIPGSKTRAIQMSPPTKKKLFSQKHALINLSKNFSTFQYSNSLNKITRTCRLAAITKKKKM